MLLIVGTVRLPADMVAAARPAMTAMVTASRAEDGCIAYHYAEDVLDPGLIHIIEKWRDQPALDLHAATDHMAAWRAAGRDLKIADRDIILYDIAGQRAI